MSHATADLGMTTFTRQLLMEINHFFFRLYSIDANGAERFLGSCFPVTPNGGLITCRHVVDIDRQTLRLAVHDNISGDKHFIDRVVLPARGVDLAYLPNALPGQDRPFLPILTPDLLKVGEEVYSYGFFTVAAGEGHSAIEQGFFSGTIVNFTKSTDSQPIWSLTLPYPMLEGMSGSPVLTYHNGPKVVGVGYMSRSSRILASEILDFRSESQHFRETIHRIVEFGLAYHCTEIIQASRELGESGIIVTTEHVRMRGV